MELLTLLLLNPVFMFHLMFHYSPTHTGFQEITHDDGVNGVITLFKVLLHTMPLIVNVLRKSFSCFGSEI